MTANYAPSSSYLALVQEFALRPLRNDTDLKAAIAMMDRLIDNRNRDAGENDYLQILADMIHTYEAETDPLPDLEPVEALRLLIEESDMTQAQLAEETGLAVATISEILNGKRGISEKVRKALAKRFRVDPSLFA